MTTTRSCSLSDMEPDPLRAALHAQWSAAAGAWAQRATFVDERGAGVAHAMLARSAPQPGERVLELACGPGGVGLAAAAMVGPAGEVVLSDVAPEMVGTARERAAALGLDHVYARALDLEALDEPDGAYDVVLCREGLMLVPDPARAAREIRRMLRPGGRAAVAVWGPRERNPWLAILLDAVGAQLGATVPPPGVPGPFSLDDPETLSALLSDAGLAGVGVEEVASPLVAASFDDWWTTVPALAGPVAQMLAALPADVVGAIRARAEEALAPFGGADGLHLPGLSLVACGRCG